jgi:hypothetical protein
MAFRLIAEVVANLMSDHTHQPLSVWGPPYGEEDDIVGKPVMARRVQEDVPQLSAVNVALENPMRAAERVELIMPKKVLLIVIVVDLIILGPGVISRVGDAGRAQVVNVLAPEIAGFQRCKHLPPRQRSARAGQFAKERMQRDARGTVGTFTQL